MHFCTTAHMLATSKFAALTYPAFSALLRPKMAGGIFAVGLIDDSGTAAGLALGASNGDTARLLSLAIAAGHQRRGHGGRLASAFFNIARDRDCRRVTAALPLESRGVPNAWLAAAQSRGWRPVDYRTLTAKITPEAIIAAMPVRDAPDDLVWRLERWSNNNAPAWAPPGLDPARLVPRAPDGRPVADDASVAILRAGEVVGWIIAHDMGGAWLRITSHLVLRTDIAVRQSFAIWRQYFTLVAARGWRTITFATSEAHPGFLRFCERKLPQHAIWWGSSADHEITLHG